MLTGVGWGGAGGGHHLLPRLPTGLPSAPLSLACRTTELLLTLLLPGFRNSWYFLFLVFLDFSFPEKPLYWSHKGTLGRSEGHTHLQPHSL